MGWASLGRARALAYRGPPRVPAYVGSKFSGHEHMFAAVRPFATGGPEPAYFFATTIVLIVAVTLSTTSTTTM